MRVHRPSANAASPSLSASRRNLPVVPVDRHPPLHRQAPRGERLQAFGTPPSAPAAAQRDAGRRAQAPRRRLRYDLATEWTRDGIRSSDRRPEPLIRDAPRLSKGRVGSGRNEDCRLARPVQIGHRPEADFSPRAKKNPARGRPQACHPGFVPGSRASGTALARCPPDRRPGQAWTPDQVRGDNRGTRTAGAGGPQFVSRPDRCADIPPVPMPFARPANPDRTAVEQAPQGARCEAARAEERGFWSISVLDRSAAAPASLRLAGELFPASRWRACSKRDLPPPLRPRGRVLRRSVRSPGDAKIVPYRDNVSCETYVNTADLCFA